MVVQHGLCQTWSESPNHVFSKRGSNKKSETWQTSLCFTGENPDDRFPRDAAHSNIELGETRSRLGPGQSCQKANANSVLYDPV